MNSHAHTPLVSVVVTTKNETRHIAACLESIHRQTYPKIEIIVVDNNSTDNTCDLARKYTNHVFNWGPERSSQRNFGLIEKASGTYGMFVDADMTLSEGLLEEAVGIMERESSLVALYVPLRWEANNWINRIRGFEREFYDGTVLDGVRFIRTDVFCKIGGFNTTLFAGEDWDLDRRVRQCGAVASTTKIMRHHEEADFNLRNLASKVFYYTPSLECYINRWGRDDPEIIKQFGFRYRFWTVFTENGKWRKLLSHPMLTIEMFGIKGFMGMVYIVSRLRSKLCK